jgi:nucleotide-binding universal stress UspA family protein
MVVLEHRHLSRTARIVNRTVAGSVAAHSRVPVVAVPSGWRRPEGRPVVVVGVDVPDRARPLLRTAARQARIRGAVLRVVHAWTMPFTYEGLELSSEEARRWTDRSAAEVAAVLADLGEATDGLDVDVVVHHGRAAEALIEASADAELLVVGRHDPLVPLGSHVGPVTRAVLREATCPVLLPDPTPRHRG